MSVDRKTAGKTWRLLSRFNKDRGGSIAVAMCIAAVPLILAAGVAVDMARASREAKSFQAAVDASALAVAASPRSNLSDLNDKEKATRKTELKQLAQLYIDQNYKNKFGASSAMTVDIDVADDAIQVNGKYNFPTAIMRIVGINQLDITANAQVKKSAGSPAGVEIVLVMDTTGSMKGSKIGAAKTAAKNLIKSVLGDKASDKNIKFALVPFSGGVKVGAGHRNSGWIDTNGSSSVSRLNFSNASWHNMYAWDQLKNESWNGCVEARPGDLAINDAAPGTGDTLFVPYFAPDESENGYNNYLTEKGKGDDLKRQKNQDKYKNAAIDGLLKNGSDKWPAMNCAASEIVPLTTSRSTVEAGIDAMAANGSTVIPEGLAWGWRVASKGAPFTEGSADDSAEWRKVIVLMTDGENSVENDTYNGSFYSAYGYGKASSGNRFGTTQSGGFNTALDTKLATLCSNIKGLKKPDSKNKSKTVSVYEIYTIVFDLNSTNVENLMKGCATDIEHYANAGSNKELQDIFSAIGERLKTMYLSK